MSKIIEVDCRENADELVRALKDKYEFDIIVKQLKIGDYLIHPDTFIERKTTKDFVTSIIDGRLFEQAYKLAEHVESSIIVLEGESFADSSLPINCVKGALISLAQTFRIPVLRTRNTDDTAWHFNQLYLQRDRIGSNRGVRTAYRTRRLDAQKKAVLKAIPGIGEKTASALLQRFESVSEIFSAKKDDLLSVHGVGLKTAAKIREIVKEEHAVYSSEPY